MSIAAQGATRDVRDRILASALVELVTHGSRGMKSAAVAKGAGTTESTMFRHFTDVVGVIRAVYDFCWSRINDELYRASFSHPPRGDALQLLTSDLEQCLALSRRDDFRDIGLVAMTYLRRPDELQRPNEGDHPFYSEAQAAFQQRVLARCRALVDEHGASIAPERLQELLVNFVATVWLTREFSGEKPGLSDDEARLALLGLVSGFLPDNASVGLRTREAS